MWSCRLILMGWLFVPGSLAQTVTTTDPPNVTVYWTYNMANADDLTEWVQTKLDPVVNEWFQNAIHILRTPGFSPPTNVMVQFVTNSHFAAFVSGPVISCNAEWFRQNRQGEAIGCFVHEMVHLIQQYPSGSNAPPAWLTEGIADYFRWYLFEPERRGAEITDEMLPDLRYDASYRISANFLHWVSAIHGEDVIWAIHGAARQGQYSDKLWKAQTGKALWKLGKDWKGAHADRLRRLRQSKR